MIRAVIEIDFSWNESRIILKFAEILNTLSKQLCETAEIIYFETKKLAKINFKENERNALRLSLRTLFWRGINQIASFCDHLGNKVWALSKYSDLLII